MDINKHDIKRFLVKSSDLTKKKLFVEFYQPKFQFLFKKLHECPYPVHSLKKLSNRMFDGPFGSNRKVEMYQDSGIPYIRVKDVLPSGIFLDELKYISQEKHNELIRSRVVPGNVLITIAGRLGTAAVFPESLKEGNITGHVVGLELSKKVNPHYITTFLNSQLGEFQAIRLGHRSTRPELNLSEVGEFIIPVPPRHIQDRIAQIMQDVYAKRQNKLSEAEILYQTIDNYVFSRLGITLEKVEEKKRFLKPITEMYESRFDVDFNMGFHKFDPYINQVLPIKAVAKFPKRTRELSNEAEAIFQYIDISSIDIKLGEIERAIELIEANAPSRARQVVHTGDILVSTVRPTRGAIALIQNEMEGFICSTGFTIIHPTEKVSSAYLHLALRLSTSLEQFRRRSAGSSYPAILESDIQETLIPVPDKEVQNAIATEVNQRCNKAKSLHTQAESLVTEAKARVERMILGEEEVT